MFNTIINRTGCAALALEGCGKSDDMDGIDDQNKSQSEKDHKELVRRHLKVLLLHLAAKSDSPSTELEALLQDVIDELHQEVKEALEAKKHLRLVVASPDSTIN